VYSFRLFCAHLITLEHAESDRKLHRFLTTSVNGPAIWRFKGQGQEVYVLMSVFADRNNGVVSHLPPCQVL